MNTDGSGQRRARVPANYSSYSHLSLPVWSPDGRKVAFGVRGLGLYGEGAALFTIDANGGGLREISRADPHDCLWPAWSADATKIAYTRNSDCEGYPDIFVVNADGTNRKRLTRDENNSDPAWSQDGQTILFRSRAISI
jgi:Tol biopolymer transport system component